MGESRCAAGTIVTTGEQEAMGDKTDAGSKCFTSTNEDWRVGNGQAKHGFQQKKDNSTGDDWILPASICEFPPYQHTWHEAYLQKPPQNSNLLGSTITLSMETLRIIQVLGEK